MAPTPSEAESLRSFLADRDVPCPRCDYNLRGLIGSLCPECSGTVELAINAPNAELARYRRLVTAIFTVAAACQAISLIVTIIRWIPYLGSRTGMPSGYWWYSLASSALSTLVQIVVLSILGAAIVRLRRYRATAVGGEAVRRALLGGAWAIVVLTASTLGHWILYLLVFVL